MDVSVSAFRTPDKDLGAVAGEQIETTRTDAEGRFQFFDTDGPSMVVRVHDNELIHLSDKQVSLTQGDVSLTVDRYAVFVSTVDELGRRVSCGLTYATWDEGGNKGRAESDIQLINGSERIAIDRPRTMEVMMWSPGRVPARAIVKPEPGRNQAEVRLVVPVFRGNPGRIRVYFEQETEHADAFSVKLWLKGTWSGGGYEGQGFYNGKRRLGEVFENIIPGQYTAGVTPYSSVDKRSVFEPTYVDVTVKAGEEAELVIAADPRARIALTMVSEEPRSPALDGTIVSWRTAGKSEEIKIWIFDAADLPSRERIMADMARSRRWMKRELFVGVRAESHSLLTAGRGTLKVTVPGRAPIEKALILRAGETEEVTLAIGGRLPE